MIKKIVREPCRDLAWVGQDLICQACGEKCTEGVDHFCKKFGHKRSEASAPDDQEEENYAWQM